MNMYRKFYQLTDVEKGALLLAHHEGNTIQYYNSYSHKWEDTNNPIWADNTSYRVKPKQQYYWANLNPNSGGIGGYLHLTEKSARAVSLPSFKTVKLMVVEDD